MNTEHNPALEAEDEDLRESLAAIEQGLADAESGRTRPFREVLDEIRNGRKDDAADDTDR
jgi:predicted transcriptional regulator